jgi:hypothetical protein
MREHEKKINELIPLAEKFATEKVNETGIESEERMGRGGVMIWNFWTEYFHAEMNRLAISRGLRNPI